MSDTALAKRQENNWAPANFSQAQELAEMVAKSGFAPEGYKEKPQDCLMAMLSGNEVGLGPMASLQNIAVINGRPSVWGDAALALVKSSQDFEWIKEWIDDEKKTAYCKVKRRGEDPVTRTFSWEDAKRAGLSNKKGPWQTFPKRMLQMRARSWAIRDVWPHVLKGLSIAEEAGDTPKERDVSPQQSTQQEHPAEESLNSDADTATNELKEILDYALNAGLIEKDDYETVVNKAEGYKKQYTFNAGKIIRKYTEQIRSHVEELKKQKEANPEDSAGGNSATSGENAAETSPEKQEEDSQEEEYDPQKDGQDDLDIF